MRNQPHRAGPSDPRAGEQARREMKTHFQFAVEHLIDLQEFGLSWKCLHDPARMQALRESVERLGALTSAIGRWVRFAEEQNYPVKTPTPLQLSEFSAEGGYSSGPAASASMFQALR